jgi:long-chain acyl-CoA synthetase
MQFDDQSFQAYTAGSTGTPKGIFHTHGGMLWGIEHSQKYWPPELSERRIIASPMFHKNAMRGNIKPTLRGGASFVVMKRFEPRPFLQVLADHKVTAAGGVPTIYAEVLKHPDLIAANDYSALATITMGSSTVPVELLERIERAFPTANVKEGYGLTEGGAPLRVPLDGRKQPIGSVGVLAPETEVKLIDADGKIDPKRGVMWMRSPYVLKEYVNQPVLTREKLQDGWFCTGDLFRVDDDGFFYFIGRNDDMFSCGGENIYPKEVENLILTLPAVADVVVTPLPHTTKGYAPAAVIVCKSGQSIAADAVQDFCAKNGAAFAVPRAILFIPEIPMTGVGKPDRRKVQAMLAEEFGTLSSRS